MSKNNRSYAFLAEEKAAVAMQIKPLSNGKKEITFAVAFCRKAAPGNEKGSDPFDPKVAVNILNNRLDTCELQNRRHNTGKVLSHFVARTEYAGTSPKKDKFIPFLNFVREALTASRQGGTQRKRNVRRVLDNLSRWETFTYPNKKKTYSLEEAQAASVCGTAVRLNTTMGVVVWPKDSEVAYSGVNTYTPMEQKASEKQARYTDWHPLLPRNTKKEEANSELKTKQHIPADKVTIIT